MRHARGFQNLATLPLDDGDDIVSLTGCEVLDTIYVTCRSGRTFTVNFRTAEVEETHLSPK